MRPGIGSPASFVSIALTGDQTMSSQVCLENAAASYLLALERVERLQRTVGVWPGAEEFLDEAVGDLEWAGEGLEWAVLYDVSEEFC